MWCFGPRIWIHKNKISTFSTFSIQRKLKRKSKKFGGPEKILMQILNLSEGIGYAAIIVERIFSVGWNKFPV